MKFDLRVMLWRIQNSVSGGGFVLHPTVSHFGLDNSQLPVHVHVNVLYA